MDEIKVIALYDILFWDVKVLEKGKKYKATIRKNRFVIKDEKTGTHFYYNKEHFEVDIGDLEE